MSSEAQSSKLVWDFMLLLSVSVRPRGFLACRALQGCRGDARESVTLPKTLPSDKARPLELSAPGPSWYAKGYFN